MLGRMEAKKTIAIIGGGVSGALTAYHLERQKIHARVVVIEPRPELGLGLAFSTPSLCHLLNVPAGKIGALPDDPDHFLRWLRANRDPDADSETFAPRAVFADYIRWLLQSSGGIAHERATVVDYRSTNSGPRLTLDNGLQLDADLVVLAMGNFEPAIFPGSHDAWLTSAYEGLRSDREVILLGTGQTAVDVLLRLRELGHRGIITAISRRGLLPTRHAPYAPLTTSAIPDGTPATCAAYLRAFRSAIRNGAEWRAAVDSLRPTSNDLWLALPLKERMRFRRHLQRRWDVVRSRMPPSVANIVDAELEAGTFVIRKGRWTAAESGCADGAVRAINCTGPSMNYRCVASPLIQSLFALGLVSNGPLGTGFHCSKDGVVLDAKGQASPTLFTLGPGRLGVLFESIAIPEIRQQAIELAVTLAERVRA